MWFVQKKEILLFEVREPLLIFNSVFKLTTVNLLLLGKHAPVKIFLFSEYLKDSGFGFMTLGSSFLKLSVLNSLMSCEHITSEGT